MCVLKEGLVTSVRTGQVRDLAKANLDLSLRLSIACDLYVARAVSVMLKSCTSHIIS